MKAGGHILRSIGPEGPLRKSAKSTGCRLKTYSLYRFQGPPEDAVKGVPNLDNCTLKINEFFWKTSRR